MVEETETRRTAKPPITHDELITRIGQCNDLLLHLKDTRANWMSNKVSFRGYNIGLVHPHIVEDPREDRLYHERGIMFVSHGNYNKEESERLFDLSNLEDRVNQSVEIARSQGVAVHAYVEENKDVSVKPNIASLTKENKTLHAVIGKNATNEDLEWIMNHEKHYGSPNDLRNYLITKGISYVRVEGIARDTWSGDKSRTPGFAEYNEELNVTYSYPKFVHLEYYMPFSESCRYDESLEQVGTFFRALGESLVFELGDDKVALKSEFRGERAEHRSINLGITNDEYKRIISRLETRKHIYDVGDDRFLGVFLQDLSRIPYLSYEESVRATRMVNPNLLVHNKLIARRELCEMRKDDKGNWQLLLPAEDYLPPESDYREPYNHSRIGETWGSDRSDLMRQVSDNRDEERRGYLLQFIDGTYAVALETNISDMDEKFRQDLARYGIDTDMNDVFNNLVLESQIGGRIKLDAKMLSEAGVPEKDINLYTYWAKRRLLESDRLQFPPDKIQARLDEVEKKLYNLRQLKSKQKQKN